MLGLRRNTLGHEAAAKPTSVPTAFPQDQRVDTNLVSLRVLRLAGRWSGRWESNPRRKLGKLGYYHYTTPAQVANSSRVSSKQANRHSYQMKEGAGHVGVGIALSVRWRRSRWVRNVFLRE